MYRERFYTKSKSLFGGMYPISKFILLLIYAVGTVLLNFAKVTQYQLPLFLIPSTLILVYLFAESKCMKAFKALLITIAVFLCLILVLQVFFTDDGSGVTLLKVGFVHVYAYGTGRAIKYLCNIVSIAGIFTWIFTSTSYRDMCLAMQKTGLSFKAAYVFLSTFGMIEALSRELKIIMNSQRARGVETTGSLKTRIAAFVPSLIPLVVSSFLGIEERALTLEAKGFSYEGKKTNIMDVFPSGKEWIGYLCGAVYLLACIGGVIICNR